MPMLSCLDCGVPTPKSRCPRCAEIREANNPRIRATPTQRGYNYQWIKIRKQILDRDGWLCQMCGKQLVGSDATVDHIFPLHLGGTSIPSNLQSLCRSDNSAKRDKVFR